jgi:hypothetical protein
MSYLIRSAATAAGRRWALLAAAEGKKLTPFNKREKKKKRGGGREEEEEWLELTASRMKRPLWPHYSLIKFRKKAVWPLQAREGGKKEKRGQENEGGGG